jgi:glycosyltransferase involved in cell wall biosynthesis
LVGENIVCFAKDWDEDPTSNHHVMRLLADDNSVLWVNSVATRRPDFANKRDLVKIMRKLLSFVRGPRKITDRLWVYTPIVLPFPHSRAATLINVAILRLSFQILRHRLGFREFQLWTFLPNTVDYTGKLGESLVVYYCVDEWAQFTNVDGGRIALMEKTLCQQADIVFAVCKPLLEEKSCYNPETHLAVHGVDFDLFGRALDEDLPIPDELSNLPNPIIGFYGTIQDWVDLDLIEYLAQRHPEWTIVMLGQIFIDIRRFQDYTNVHFLGRKSHDELPNYCKGFAVGIIPYILSDRMRYVNPLKLREYLCAGLPVVSTAVPEVVDYKDYCTIAHDYEEFDCAILRALANDTPQQRTRRNGAMRTETWKSKVGALGVEVMRVKTAKKRFAQ